MRHTSDVGLSIIVCYILLNFLSVSVSVSSISTLSTNKCMTSIQQCYHYVFSTNRPPPHFQVWSVLLRHHFVQFTFLILHVTLPAVAPSIVPIHLNSTESTQWRTVARCGELNWPVHLIFNICFIYKREQQEVTLTSRDSHRAGWKCSNRLVRRKDGHTCTESNNYVEKCLSSDYQTQPRRQATTQLWSGSGYSI